MASAISIVAAFVTERGLDLPVYPDDISRPIAGGGVEAGGNLRFSLPGPAPATCGGTEHHGVRAILPDFLIYCDADGTAVRLEAAYRP